MKEELIKTTKCFVIAIGILAILSGLVWGTAICIPKLQAYQKEKVVQLQVERQKANIERVTQEKIRQHRDREEAQAEVNRKNAERAALRVTAIQVPPTDKTGGFTENPNGELRYTAVVKSISTAGVLIQVRAKHRHMVLAYRQPGANASGDSWAYGDKWEWVEKELKAGDDEWADRTVLIKSYPHPENLSIGDIFPQTMCAPTSNTDSIKTFVAL